jgi:hypothetical protein
MTQPSVSVDLASLRKRNQLVLNVLYNSFQKLQKMVEFIGYVKTSTEDIDLIVILADDRNGKKDKNLSQRQREFEKTFNNAIQELIRRFGFHIFVYPHFRDKALYELLRYRGIYNNNSNKIIFIHLHYFETYNNFVKTTFPMVAKTIVNNLQPIVGDTTKLKQIVEKIPMPTLHDCLEFLKGILYDVRCFLMLSIISDDSIYSIYMDSILYRIFYIVRYLTFYILHFEYKIPIQNLLTWDKLKNEIEYIEDLDLIFLFNKIYSWKFEGIELTLDDVKELLDKILTYIQSYKPSQER